MSVQKYIPGNSNTNILSPYSSFAKWLSSQIERSEIGCSGIAFGLFDCHVKLPVIVKIMQSFCKEMEIASDLAHQKSVFDKCLQFLRDIQEQPIPNFLKSLSFEHNEILRHFYVTTLQKAEEIEAEFNMVIDGEVVNALYNVDDINIVEYIKPGFKAWLMQHCDLVLLKTICEEKLSSDQDLAEAMWSMLRNDGTQGRNWFISEYSCQLGDLALIKRAKL